MLGCSFVHALQQRIFAYINRCMSRIMHLKFLRCQQTFYCFPANIMGCQLTFCLLFCEVVCETGISNHWLLLCMQFWCCVRVIEITLVTRPPSMGLIQPGVNVARSSSKRILCVSPSGCPWAAASARPVYSCRLQS
jgi:hypothetical protein